MSKLVLIGDPKIRAIEVKDNGEFFVDLTALPNLNFDHSRQQVQKLGNKIFWARKEVGNRLLLAQEQLPNGLQLQIKECFRPLWVQAKFWQEYSDHLRLKNSGWSEVEIEQEAMVYAAPVEIAPHATGGAVDLILLDARGMPLEMGTEFNASPFETQNRTFTDSLLISTEAKVHRKILVQAMSVAGFVNYPTEWWHWSYGDQYWAYVEQRPAAIYARSLDE